jgi:serine/threonine-protein kinase
MNNTQLTRRYELIDLIGSGASADVFRARDTRDGRLVAVKRLRDMAPQSLALFVREAEIMARLEHPMALPIFDFGRDTQGRPFLVTELLEGETLADLLARGPLDPLLAVRLIRQISDVLAVAHTKGIVHRDIKPQNIWIQAQFNHGRGPNVVARLLDWGVAYVPSSRRLTRLQMPVGSPRYMAPEQAAEHAIDGRADLYGLGVVAYECLSGRAPFAGGSATAELLRHLNQRPNPLALACPNVDPGLCHLVDRLLARDPEHRPSSAHALNRLLSEIEDRLMPTRARPRRRHNTQPAYAMATVFSLF